MINRLALLLVIFTLFTLTPTLAAEVGDGVIEGRIINGSIDGSSVAELEINLKINLDNNEVESITTTTDADGRFVFRELSTEPGYSYQVVLSYQDAEYDAEHTSFVDGEKTKSIEITVYDSTASDEAIRIVMAHTIVYVEEGSLRIVEYSLLVNDSDLSYVGSKEIPNEDRRETLSFFLPREGYDLQISSGLMSCCIYSNENRFVDSMPMLPGNKEVVYSYNLDYNSDEYIFTRNMNYPASNYDLIIQSGTVEIVNGEVMRQEPLEIDGKQFSHFSGSNFAAGDDVAVRLSNLSGASDQPNVIWVVIALVVLIIGSGSVYILRRRKVQSAEFESDLQKKRQLLNELAQLDDDFESGKMNEDIYHHLRAEKKSQLTALLRAKKSYGDK